MARPGSWCREEPGALAQAMAAMADPEARRRDAERAPGRARAFAPEPVGAALLRPIERLPARGRRPS